MERETHNKIKVAGIFCVTVVISMLGIWGPGVLLHSADNLKANQVANVPDAYYSASKTAMARNNSKSMKDSEKLQLISGQWESTIMKANDYEMIIDNYEAVKIVKDELSKMNQLDLYPSSFSEEYGNWYSWDVECFKAVDATFNTYTAYYWVINLVKYDGSEKHTAYVLDNGRLFLAKAWYSEAQDLSDIIDAYDIKEMESKAADINLNEALLSDWVSYPDMELGDMRWKALSFKQETDGEYSIVQAYTDNEYLYSYTPYLLV